MAKKIQKSDISEEDVFKGIRESAKNTLSTIKKLNDGLNKTAETLKNDIKNAKFANSADINKFTKAVNEANKARKEAVKLDQQETKANQTLAKSEAELERIKREKLKTEREEIKTAQARKKAKEQEQKATERNARSVENERNAYKRLVVETRNNKNESKRLAARLLELEAAGKKNTKGFRDLEKEYKRVTKAAQKGDQQLKKIDKTVGDNFRNVGNYKGAINGLRNSLASLGLAFGAFAIVKDVFNVVKDFDQAQANLASVLGVTRDQMAALTEQAKELGATTKFTAAQVSELQLEFAKLGFTQSEIQNVTESTLQLAAAAGTELSEAAAVAGATIRGFGLDTTETQRVVDVMAKSFSSSSLDMSKFSTAMAAVAPVAKSAGLNIERTTALLGTLTDRGIDASTAGTGLRNIFLQLTKNGLTFEQAMEKVNSASDKSAAALDLFGTRGATLGVILAENGASVDELEGKLNNAAGAAGEMADKQLNTLSGALDLLRSAWEGFILKLNEGSGAGKALQGVIKFLADNLDTILTTVVYGIQIYGLWTAATYAQIAANKLLSRGLTGTFDLIKGGFGKIANLVKANALGIALAGIAAGFMQIKSTLKQLNAPFERINRLKERFTEISSNATKKIAEEKVKLKLLVGEIKRHNAGSKERGKLIKELNEKYGTHLKNIKDETRANRELDIAQKTIIANMRTQIQLQARQEKYTEAVRTTIEAQDDFNAAIEDQRKKIDSLSDKEVKDWIKRIAGASTQMDAIKKLSVAEQRRFLIYDNLSSAQLNKKIALERALEIEKGLEEDLEEQMKKNNGAISSNIEVTEQSTNAVKKKEKAYKDLTAEIEKAAAAERQLLELTEDYAIQDIEAQVDDRIAAETLAAEETGKVNFEVIDRLLDKEEELKRARIERQALEKIEAATTAEEVELAYAEMTQNLIELEDEITDKRQSTINDLNEAQESYAETVTETTEEIVESEDNAAARRREIARTLTDYLLKESDRRIKGIDDEIEKAEFMADHLRELAAQGNIEASESIAEQQRIIAEANRAREKELQRQQRIKLASTIYDTYQSKIEAGSAQPLAETIRDTALLQAFISSLPAFEEGTEDTGKNGRGVDGRGGFHAILHPNERVLTKDQNEMIGDLSNTELAKLAQDYNAGALIHDGAKQIGGAWESAAIVKKLTELQQTIQNKPENNIELERIIDGTMKITRTTKKGNSVVYNRYKVRK